MNPLPGGDQLTIDRQRQFEQSLAAKLKEWQAQIDAIKSRSHKVNLLNLIEFERQLDLLFAKHDLAQEKLAKLQSAEGLEWDNLKRSLDGIRNEIENALDSASAKID